MKTRDEISAMLGGFVDAKPDEQGTLIAGVLDEFDECRNEAEQLIFAAKKSVTELGDEVTAEEKANVESGVEALEKALSDNNFDEVKVKKDELEKLAQELAVKVYSQAAEAAQGYASPRCGDKRRRANLARGAALY